MAAISIVVPVYNSEDSIGKTLDSIITQTMGDIEIICVNDGSTDRSGTILEQYKNMDSRIKVFHINNQGALAARKYGIQHASSRYIGFVDSDDWVDNDMFKSLYNCMIQYDVDMVCSGFVFEGRYKTYHYDGLEDGLYVDSDMRYVRENVIYNVTSKKVGIRGSMWCKLFKTSIMRDIQNRLSDELTFSEDKMCILTYILECRSVYILHRAFYHYLANYESLTHTPDTNYLLRVNEVYKHFLKLYPHPNFTDTMQLQAEIYITELLYKGINQRMGFKNSNMLWIDPYYIEKIPNNSKLILYGGGELGETYYKQLSQRCDLDIIGCIALSNAGIAGVKSINIKELDKIGFDYILITIKNVDKSEEIKRELIEIGMPEERILWFDQTEIFWKFADAMGYLE